MFKDMICKVACSLLNVYMNIVRINRFSMINICLISLIKSVSAVFFVYNGYHFCNIYTHIFSFFSWENEREKERSKCQTNYLLSYETRSIRTRRT